MAKWTISEYSALPTDGGGNPMMIGRPSRASQGATVGGTITVGAGSRFVRFCGDTAAHVQAGGTTASTADEYVAAGVDYWFATDGRTSFSFIAG